MTDEPRCCKRLQEIRRPGTVYRMAASPTLADVARRAGVHSATVSRALSRPEMVNGATLQRVHAAVEALGYVPNNAARQLAGGRTGRIAVIVPDVTNPYFGGLVQAAQRRADDGDEIVVLADTGQRPGREVAAVRSLAAEVDGIVLCGSVGPVGDLRAAAGETPVVSVNRRMRGVPSVVVDQEAVVDLAVDHLRLLGHERIAFLRGPSAYWSTQARTRRADALDLQLVGPAEPTHDGGRDALDGVRSTGATAVVVFNDLMAAGLLAEASNRGVRVPDELSLVGSDDVSFAAMVHPALTTVAGRADDLGAAAVDLLHDLASTDSVGDVSLEPYLVVRATTSAPA